MTAATADSALHEHLAAGRAELHALQVRLDAGEITVEDFDLQRRALAAQLLAAAPVVDAVPRRRSSVGLLPSRPLPFCGVTTV